METRQFPMRMKMRTFLVVVLTIVLLSGVSITALHAAAKVVELPDVMKVQTVVVDKGQLFITEGTTIYIYSLKDFKLQAKFGKRGDGPGEFRDIGFGVRLEPTPDALIVYSPGRVSYFTRDGKFIKEKPVTDPRKGQFKKLGDKYVGTTMKRENQKVWFALNLYDEELKVLKELYKYEHPFFPKSKKINPLNARVCSFYVYGKKIFFDDAEGNINIFDGEGEKVSLIKPSYEGVSVSEKNKKKYMGSWKISLKAEYEAFKDRFRFPSVFPPIRNYHVVDDKVLVLTYKEKEGKSQLYIYSLEGKLLKTVYVPLADVEMLLPSQYNYYTITEGKLYKLVENLDEEVWELHISGI